MRKTLLVVACFFAIGLGIAALTFSGSTYARADFTFTNGTEPETIDPHRMTGQPDGRIAFALFEGLTYWDPPTLDPVPGVAERWDVSEDLKTWTFHLRKDARWSNGDPVTAHDFWWSWKRVLEPETAAKYSYMLFDVVNAEAYNKAEITDFSEVGIELVDDYTLRVRLRWVVPYFLDLTSFYTLLPVHPPSVEKWEKVAPGRWTLQENIVTNGPFLLEDWVVNDRFRLRKNHDYWNADSIRLETIDALSVDDTTACLNAYLRGEAEWNPSYWPASLNKAVKKHPEFEATDAFIVYYYRINNTREQFKDVRVRKALSLAIDRKELVENVLGLGETEAYTFVPPGIKGYEPPPGLRRDPAEARRLLAEAGYPGGKGFPPIEVLYNTHEAHRQVAVVIARQLQDALGITVNPRNQEWQSYLKNTQMLQYDLARAGWIGDYLDPNTFLDMWVTDGGNNETGYSSALYDRLHLLAKDIPAFVEEPDEELYGQLVEGDVMRRMVEDARKIPRSNVRDRIAATSRIRLFVFREMERLICEIDVPIIPIYFYVAKTLVKPHIGGCHTWIRGPGGERIPNVRDLHPLRGFFIKEEAR